MAYRNIILGLFLFAATSFAVWTTILIYRPREAAIAQTSNEPDAFMENVTALIMDKFGKPKMKIITPKMTHYVENDYTHLASPELTIYRQSPQPWYVTSRYAVALQGAEQIDFHENVVIRHSADDNGPATVVNTSDLTVYPNKQTAATSAFVKMTQPNMLVTSIGMQADMNSGEIRLLSKARGVYEPDA